MPLFNSYLQLQLQFELILQVNYHLLFCEILIKLI